MQLSSAEIQKIQQVTDSISSKPVTGTEMEQMVGIGLVGDLNQQLADISSQMGRQIQEKQNLRGEIETIDQIQRTREVLEINGQKYRDVSPGEAELLGVTQEAIPQTDEAGQVLGYRLGEDLFQKAVEGAIHQREDGLASLNGEGELVMLKIQSLVDQRKNALTLLSNLLAASGDVARTIIGNMRS
jgi:hypothetical protein